MSEIIIDATTRHNAPYAIGLIINSNFFVYDSKYQVGVRVPSSEILRIECFNRGLLPEEEEGIDLLALLRPQLPSLRWQMTQLRQLAVLPLEERELIGEYASHGSDTINNDLVARPEQVAPLNTIIAQLPPLEQDIIVYRYIRKYELGGSLKSRSYLPPESGEYEYHSYLSTSFMSYLVINQTACLGRGSREIAAIMRIRVPKGTHCMAVPSTIDRPEYELLFPHQTRIRVDEKSQQVYVCDQGVEREFTTYDVTMLH